MSTTRSPTPLNLLSLPFEVRQQIYSHAIPPTRLCARRHCSANPQVLTACPYCADRFSRPEPRNLPSLLLVCKATYSDSISIFYSKAILELVPLRIPNPATSLTRHQSGSDWPSFPTSMNAEYAFCPPSRLRQIHTAYIWTHDSTSFNMHNLRAVLKWTLMNTAPTEIHVAKPAVETLMRKRWVMPMAAEWKAMVKEVKAVCEQEIWASHARPSGASGKLELEGQVPVVKVLGKVEVLSSRNSRDS